MSRVVTRGVSLVGVTVGVGLMFWVDAMLVVKKVLVKLAGLVIWGVIVLKLESMLVLVIVVVPEAEPPALLAVLAATLMLMPSVRI